MPILHGPGTWILNTSILLNADFVSSIRVFWSAWRLKKSSLPSLFFFVFHFLNGGI